MQRKYSSLVDTTLDDGVAYPECTIEAVTLKIVGGKLGSCARTLSAHANLGKSNHDVD